MVGMEATEVTAGATAVVLEEVSGDSVVMVEVSKYSYCAAQTKTNYTFYSGFGGYGGYGR